MRARTSALIAIATLATAGPLAHADEPSKAQCVEAHSRGQDARANGQLTLARKVFLSCAQASCPALVQEDCARFADELDRQQPTLVFVARDGAGADLPDTAVVIDDTPVTKRLDDGNAYDVDPGKHLVRFIHDGRHQEVTVVVNPGEKARAVVATFADPAAAVPATRAPPPAPPPVAAPPARGRTRPTGAKVLIGGGAVLLAGGVALALYELGQLPANCSLDRHTCAAPPGDPSLDAAARAIRWTDVGIGVAGVGAAAVVGGVVWYVTGGTTPRETRRDLAVAPWFAPRGGGVALSGAL